MLFLLQLHLGEPQQIMHCTHIYMRPHLSTYVYIYSIYAHMRHDCAPITHFGILATRRHTSLRIYRISAIKVQRRRLLWFRSGWLPLQLRKHLLAKRKKKMLWLEKKLQLFLFFFLLPLPVSCCSSFTVSSLRTFPCNFLLTYPLMCVVVANMRTFVVVVVAVCCFSLVTTLTLHLHISLHSNLQWR